MQENEQHQTSEDLCSIKNFKELYMLIKHYILKRSFGLSMLFILCAILLVYFGFKTDKDLFSAAGAFTATAAIFYGSYLNHQDKTRQNSDFILNEVKNYLLTAVSSINERENSNIAWHKAINYLKQAEDLYDFLNEDIHKIVYVNNYIIAAYTLIDVINKIDSYKFFFGIKNYQDKTLEILFEESTPKDSFLNGKMTAISCVELKVLQAFYDKASRYQCDRRDKNTIYSAMFNADYSSIKIYDPKYIPSPHGIIPAVDKYIQVYSELNKIRESETIKANRAFVQANDLDEIS